jgi:hypothetical protein
MSTADAVIYAKEISDIVRCAATSAAIVRLPTIWPELCNFQSYFIVDKKGDQIHQTIAQAVVVSKWNNLNYPLKILKLRCNNDGVKGESRVQGGAPVRIPLLPGFSAPSNRCLVHEYKLKPLNLVRTCQLISNEAVIVQLAVNLRKYTVIADRIA